MTSDAPRLCAEREYEAALDAAKIEKIEQGVILGQLSPKCVPSWVAVNDRSIAVLNESHLLPASASDDAPLRRFALDLRSLAPELLLADHLSFALRTMIGTQRTLDCHEIPTNAFLKPVRRKLKDSTLEGFIDEYSTGRLRGWVWDRANPQRPVVILAFLERRFIGRHVADKYRPDLAALGKGDGRAGFDVDISPFLAQAVHGARGLEVYSEDPEGWIVPLAGHLRSTLRKRIAGIFRSSQSSMLGALPNTTEEFVAQLVQTPPYPKKVFDISAVAKKKMPDPYSADYTLLAIEFLRREAAMLSEALSKETENWRQNNAQLRLVESQMAHLCKLGEAIATSQKLMHAASATASLPLEKKDEDRYRKT